MMSRTFLGLIAVTVIGAASALPTIGHAAAAAPAAAAAASAASAASAAASGPRTVSLPVVVCPTHFGIKPPPPVAEPRSRTVRVPRGLRASLAVYTDSEGVMALVAPSGWACDALIAADGSSDVAVFPRGERLPDGPLPRTSAVQAVYGTQTSACVGCTLFQACPLFADASRTLRSDGFGPCPARPAAEEVTPLGAGLAGFADPPGVSGAGHPSGGRYPARGVMTYHPHAQDGSWAETCTLPASDTTECEAILNVYLSWYGSR